MIYENMNKPSANMIKPINEIFQMERELNEDIYQKEKDKLIKEQSEITRERDSYNEFKNEYIEDHLTNIENRNRLLEGVKRELLKTSIMHLFKESYSGNLNERDKVIVKNLITSFINEQDTGNLLNRFKYQNTLLAEMGRIIKEAYNNVVDDIDKRNNDESNKVKEFKFDTTIVDDFYKDIEDLDTEEASQLIRDKVADAMSDFVDQNMQNKIDYQDIISQAKEKMEVASDESMAEAYMEDAKRRINEYRNTRPKNVFHYVVEAISTQAFKNDNLNKRYIHENAVDMDGVVESAELIYTFLEMLNTTEMVDESYIHEYLTNMINA